MSTGTAETVLQVEQPIGEPIELAAEDQALYKSVVKKTNGKRQGQVPQHLVAAAVDGTRSYNMPKDDLIGIVQAWSQISSIVEEEPGAPIIHDGTASKSIGIADPEHPTTWFKHSTVLGHRPDSLMIRATKVIDMHTWAELNEGGEEYAEGVDLESFRPYRVLTSGADKDVEHFREYHADWMKYPGSRLIVGTSAVRGYLQAQADTELSGEIPYWGNRVRFTADREGFSNSSLLYDVAALKTLGHEVPLGEERERAIHRSGVEVVASFIVSALQEGYGSVLHEGETGAILRRLPAANISMEHVAEITEEASRLIGAKLANPTNDFVAHANHQGNMDLYIGETTANFMRHVLGVEEKL